MREDHPSAAQSSASGCVQFDRLIQINATAARMHQKCSKATARMPSQSPKFRETSMSARDDTTGRVRRKLVVVTEAPDAGSLGTLLNTIQSLPHVYSAALVFHAIETA